MKIAVIGAGYVGLVTAAVLAHLGNEVVCIDSDTSKVEKLRRGEMPFFEPGLAEMVEAQTRKGALWFSVSSAWSCEAVFICVGTPALPGGAVDLSQVEAAARAIGRDLHSSTIVVNKSTVPAGTARLVREIIEANCRNDHSFDVVSNPEFLREGSAINDSLVPDRIVIGADNPEAAAKIAELYAPLKAPVVIMDTASAEMTKYASNAFLATKISFINAVANICEAAGADVLRVAEGMGLDRRIGPAFLHAGLGYGGSCFPKDTLGLLDIAGKLGYDFHLLLSVIETNTEQVERFLDRLGTALGWFRERTICVLGLAFKPDTDDLRDARSLEIIGKLLEYGATVRAYDPLCMERAREVLPEVEFGETAIDAAAGADAVLLVTEWEEFRSIDMAALKEAMTGDLFFDGRNMFEPGAMKRLGFRYFGVGR